MTEDHDSELFREEQTEEEISAYWAPERLEALQPAPAPSIDSVDVMPEGAIAADAPGGELFVGEGGTPAAYRKVDKYPHTLWPAPSTGRLTTSWGASSGFIINGWGVPIGVTAAHVLYNPATRKHATNVALWLGYNTRYDPGTMVTIKAKVIPLSWMNGPNYAYDMAVFTINQSFSGVWMAWTTKQNFPGGYRAYGYPAEPNDGYPFAGKYLWECVADLSTGSWKTPDKKAGMVYMNSPFSPGASGGPWIGWFNDYFWCNGIQSTWSFTRSSSPYFGDEFRKMVLRLAG